MSKEKECWMEDLRMSVGIERKIIFNNDSHIPVHDNANGVRRGSMDILYANNARSAQQKEKLNELKDCNFCVGDVWIDSEDDKFFVIVCEDKKLQIGYEPDIDNMKLPKIGWHSSVHEEDNIEHDFLIYYGNLATRKSAYGGRGFSNGMD